MGGDFDLIILGASARAAAASAVHAGMRPWCCDLFADLDLQAMAVVHRCPRQAYPHGMLAILEAAALPARIPVLLTGAMENDPQLIATLEAQRPLLTSSALAVRAVRDPEALPRLVPGSGLRFCPAQVGPGVVTPQDAHRYLIKPQRGRGPIRFATAGEPVAADAFVQRYVSGRTLSAVYVGGPSGARLFGATQQLVGEPVFATRSFRYCGSIGPIDVGGQLGEVWRHLGHELHRAFGLRGVFGVDAVLDHNGDLWPVEVNPRYTAGVEVLERAVGRSVLAPDRGAASVLGAARGPQFGKAIVYASETMRAPDVRAMFGSDRVADVPVPGEIIEAGWPVCTLLAQGPARDVCMDRLAAMGRRLAKL
jgi:predicted ATP-grasp superfamily ATP-dependent carboligase